MTDKQFPWGRLFLFCVLSIADLILTWRLLEAQGEAIYESNPIAKWFLSRHGWAGLAAYKAGTVLAVSSLIGLICRYRPATGARVLTFGCSLLSAVVLYSCFLPRLYGVLPEATADDVPYLRAEGKSLESRLDAAKARIRHRRALLPQLAAGRCTLAEAVDLLESMAGEREPGWMAYLAHLYPGYTGRELIAANLVHIVAAKAGDYPGQVAVPVEALYAQYQKLFGKPCPPRPFHGSAARRVPGQPLKASPSRRRTA